MSDYTTTAERYWAKGWRSVLPIPHRKKSPPPAGYTGVDAKTPAWPDIQSWIENGFIAKAPGEKFGRTATAVGANVALRMQVHNATTGERFEIIGIDVDAYGEKTGGKMLAFAEQLWGALPDPYMSTSRTDGSGIRFYRVPARRKWLSQIKFGDELGDIEIIQRTHRYAVVWPSTHPSGRQYHWAAPDGNWLADGEIPAPEDFSELPQRWCDELTAADTLAAVSTTGERMQRTDGEMSATVAERLDKALADLKNAGSRHDSTCANVFRLADMAAVGESGTATALARLRAAFVAAVTGSAHARAVRPNLNSTACGRTRAE